MSRLQKIEVLESTDPIYLATITMNGAVFNITNCTLAFIVKANASTADSSPMFVHTIGEGITITDAEHGLAEIKFAKANLDEPGTYWYHLDITFVDDRVETIAYGLFIVTNV